jgi:hypothetical protein
VSDCILPPKKSLSPTKVYSPFKKSSSPASSFKATSSGSCPSGGLSKNLLHPVAAISTANTSNIFDKLSFMIIKYFDV